MKKIRLATYYGLLGLIFIFNINAGGGGSYSSGLSSSGSSSGGSSLTSGDMMKAVQLKNRLGSIERLLYSDQFSQALTQVRLLDNEYPDNADINNYYGFIYRKMGQYGKSGQFYKKALQLDPRHKGALEYQGELFIKTNKKELAEKNLILLKNICGTSCPEYKKLEKALRKAY